jgi:hypothetical protein
LIEPVQDQVLVAIQDLGKSKKYDYIFDKSADVVMLFSNKRYDLSEYIIRTLQRTSKRNQAKDRKTRKKVESEKDIPIVKDPVLDAKAEKRKLIEDKKAARKKDFEERRKKLIEENKAKRKAVEDKRKKAAADKEAKRNNNSNVPGLPNENNNEE